MTKKTYFSSFVTRVSRGYIRCFAFRSQRGYDYIRCANCFSSCKRRNKWLCLTFSLLTAIKTNKFNQSLRTTVALAELQGNHDTGSSLQDIQWKFRDYKVSDYAILDYCEVVQQFLVLLSLPVVHHHPEKVAETFQNSKSYQSSIFKYQNRSQPTFHPVSEGDFLKLPSPLQLELSRHLRKIFLWFSVNWTVDTFKTSLEDATAEIICRNKSENIIDWWTGVSAGRCFHI